LDTTVCNSSYLTLGVLFRAALVAEVIVVVDMIGAIEPPGGGTTNSFDLLEKKLKKSGDYQ